MTLQDDPACPVITSLREANALGVALHKVLHFDLGWAGAVYSSSPQFTHQLGKEVLNRELQSMWCQGYTTLDERRRIVAEMVVQRLSS
jgi:hypothetical protein